MDYPGISLEWDSPRKGVWKCYSFPYSIEVYRIEGDHYITSICIPSEMKDGYPNFVYNNCVSGGLEFAENNIRKWHKNRFEEYNALHEEFREQGKQPFSIAAKGRDKLLTYDSARETAYNE